MSGQTRAGRVPLAFVGRVSSAELQDPTISIPRQLTEVQAKLPDGFYIAAHYWDVESGALSLADRGHGRDHELFDVPVPRNGGLADLRRDAAGPDRAFQAVMCSSIERTARESVDSQQLERELWQQGLPLLAADEPLQFDRSNPGTVLFRRVKQGVGEWFRLDLLVKSWSGMRTHSEQGWNTGPVPYGFVADRVPHPVPAKRALGMHKTKLLADPERAKVVPVIFQWRVELRLGYVAIANRLNADPTAYPPAVNNNGRDRAGYWTHTTVKSILRNPKYTGHMVWNMRKDKSTFKGRSEWVWSPEPTHPALVSRELWEQAQAVGAVTEGSRQGHGVNPHPQTQRTYLLRSFVRCAICGRRLIGKTKTGITYYACQLDHSDPRVAERFPDHPRAVVVREDVLHGAIDQFFAEHVFGPRRGELFRQHFDEAAARAHAEHAERIASLETRITTAEQAQRTLTRELGSYRPTKGWLVGCGPASTSTSGSWRRSVGACWRSWRRHKP
jgi:hypothetical protein